MARPAGAILVRERVQQGVVERAQAHPLRAGEIEAARAQVDLVTEAVHMRTHGPIAVPRRPILQELTPQVPLRAEEVEGGAERARIPEGGRDGVKAVVAQPLAIRGPADARPPFGSLAGDGVDP